MVCNTNLFNFINKTKIMNATSTKKETFGEQQVLQTIKTALNTSRKILMKDGILLLCWGLVLSFGFAWNYCNSALLVPSRIRDLMIILKPLTTLLLIVFTFYFVFFRKPKVKTYSALSTRFVWLGVIIAQNLNVIISRTMNGEVNYELLHPLQMTLIGFALFVTGGIYRFYILSVSGALMWIAAGIAAGYDLNTQYLIRSIADFVCFVVPGTLMYLEAKKGNHV